MDGLRWVSDLLANSFPELKPVAHSYPIQLRHAVGDNELHHACLHEFPNEALVKVPNAFFLPNKPLLTAVRALFAATLGIQQLLVSSFAELFPAARPINSISIASASAATPSGFLQVVVSKARKHTVLVCAACSLALPIQH